MGGDYEDTIATKAPAKAGASGDEHVLQDLRFHISGGQVHFHDDKTKLKAAVPVSDWWKALSQLTSPSERVEGRQPKLVAHYSYIDPDNKTILLAESEAVLGKGKPGLVAKTACSLSIQVLPANLDQTWTTMNTFRNRAR